MPEVEIALPAFHPKQQIAFDSLATDLLFGGATRGGKSYFVRRALIEWCAQIPGLQCDIFRLHEDDIIKEAMLSDTGFHALLAAWVRAGLVKINQTEIQFWNGSAIYLCHCFVGSTEIQTTEGVKTIFSLLGRDGYANIAKNRSAFFRSVRKTRASTPIVEVKFDDGQSYKCTPDHKFITTVGPIEAQHLAGHLCLTNESSLSAIQNKYLMGDDILCKEKNITAAIPTDYIGLFGNIIKAQSRKVLKFITKMGLLRITKLKIWSVLKSQNIEAFTQKQKPQGKEARKALNWRDLPRANGTEAPTVSNGTSGNTLKSKVCDLKDRVLSVARYSWGFVIANIVGLIARQDRGERSSVKRCLSVVSAGHDDVYCLTVPDYGFFALGNGILALNCADDKVMLKHQGIARHVRVFVEATQIVERRIKWLSAWVTMSEEMKSRVPDKWKNRFPKIIHVTNPIGVSAPYYKREYVKAAKPYDIWEVNSRYRQYIPALVSDNPSENAEQTKSRVLGMGDAAIARALLEADWDAITGEYFSEWNERRHVVADCYPPHHWYRFRSFDWGTAEPAACCYIAVSDGEPFKDQSGKMRWFPRGALLFYNELYLADKTDPAKGARMRNEDMAAAILQHSEYEHQNVITLTDSKPFQDMGGYSIAKVFSDCGVLLTMADTSRVPGWSQVRSRLIGKHIDTNSPKVPMIFFCERCTAARDYMPALTRHKSESKPEDAAEHGEATHVTDAIRYGCMASSHNVIKDRIEPMEVITLKSLAQGNTMRDITGGLI